MSSWRESKARNDESREFEKENSGCSVLKMHGLISYYSGRLLLSPATFSSETGLSVRSSRSLEEGAWVLGECIINDGERPVLMIESLNSRSCFLLFTSCWLPSSAAKGPFTFVIACFLRFCTIMAYLCAQTFFIKDFMTSQKRKSQITPSLTHSLASILQMLSSSL